MVPSALPAKLKASEITRTGPFSLAFMNTPGTSCSIWSATNLALPFNLWARPGHPRETAPGQFQLSDPRATNGPWQFYRISSPGRTRRTDD